MKTRNSLRLSTGVIEATARAPAVAISVKVTDVSTGGCRVVGGEGQVRRGTTVLLSIFEESDLAGQVVWTNRQGFGVQFHRAIDAEVVSRLALAAGATSG